jgi:3',5'-cyclic-AMP phosphodiesterase
MKFIHLTDTHIVPEGQRLYGRDPAVTLRAAVAHINHHHPDAAFVVITGDLTERGELAAYVALQRTLAPLVPPCHLVIGNHDRHANFFAVFDAFPPGGSGHLQYVRRYDDGTCILLDTVKPGEPGGELCAARLAWLADTLDRHADDDVYLFMHHPPIDVGIDSMDRRGLSGREALADVLKRHRKIRHLFCGHLHRPLHGVWHGVPVACQRSTSHQVDLILSPEERTFATLEPPAYSVVLTSPAGTVVHHCDFTDGSPRFDLRDPAMMAASDPETLARLAREAGRCR